MSTKSTSDVQRLVSDALDEAGELVLLTLAIVLLGAFFSVLSPVFFSVGNFVNIVRQTALVIVLGLGMTYVIISAEIDVSIGGVMALSAVPAAIAINAYGPLVGVLVGLAVGVVFGFFNGLITVRFGIPSFIVTIGTLGIARGGAFIVSQQEPVIVRNDVFSAVFGGTVGPVPTIIVWALGLSVLAGIALWKTRFGRHVYATGDSEQAARYSGIDTDRVKILTLTLSGLAAAMAGLLFVGRLGVARPGMGSGIELAVIAAVIIGGTSLFGGRGTIVGTILGALLISVIDNGLTLLGYGSSWQQLIRGIVIIVAVALRARDEDGEWL
ncbi:ABC transporter permease [Halogeometricum limi]|uniref:Ribose transport system permease protein n=1 Tax=Halogeometricum limi TaxID=555875 RepID=A0A1I6IDF1_9EURY|nr:ABC transporter permease [Halogeometricum limi]SFR64716.1 ribose transport system permease protein [Halogeometricum limi]